MRVERYDAKGELIEVSDNGQPDPGDRRRDLRSQAAKATTVAQLREVVVELLDDSATGPPAP